MESQHGSNLKNIRKKRATAQQSIVSLSCLVCIAFAAIWGFHAGSGNSRAVEAKKMSASSSVTELREQGRQLFSGRKHSR